MSSVFIAAPYIELDFAVFRNADWDDVLPRLRMGGVPINLTGKNLVCYIRPDHDFATLLTKLSHATGEIIYPDAVNGESRIYVPRADVITALPVGKWRHHWVLEDTSPTPDSFLQPFRGEIDVYAGSIAP